MKKLSVIILLLIAVSALAYRFVDVGLQLPYRTGAPGQVQKIVQDKYLRAVKSLWIPFTNSTTPTLNNTIDSVGNGFQLLSNGRFAISKGLTTGFFQYPDITEINALIAASGSGGTVTSITPGYGFTINTPITTFGTMVIDTATKIRSFDNSFNKAEVNSQINSLAVRNQTGTIQSSSFRISGTGQLAKIGIGTGAAASVNFDNRANITGSGTSLGELLQASVQSGVTTSAYGRRSIISTAAASFTLPNLYVNSVGGGTVGSGSTLSSQTAYNVESNFTNATENIGFRSNIATSATNFSNYHAGSAQNYFQGNSTFGTTSDSGDKVYVVGSVRATQFKVSALNTAPASATASGQLGEIRFVNGFLYLCVAANSWQRVALATW